MDHHHHGRHPVHGGVLALRRQRVWTSDRHHRGHRWRFEALANVGGPHPWWSLGVFAICLWVIHGIWVLGQPEDI
jgi:hypothetical protein